MSLQRALLLLVATALLAGIVPAGILIDRRLAAEVEARARDELLQARSLQAASSVGSSEANVMHAKEIASAPKLADALLRGERPLAIQAAETARGDFGDAAVVVTARGTIWAGPIAATSAMTALLERVRRGETPTEVVADSGALHMVTLVSVFREGVWLGAAGLSVKLDKPAAGALSGITRSGVIFLGVGGNVVASTFDDSVSAALAAHVAKTSVDGSVTEAVVGNQRFLVNAIATGDAGTTVFARDFTHDLAVLPAFRRVIIFSGVAAMLLGLLLGTLVARRVARPVVALVEAAGRLTAGDANAPLMHSSIREIDRLSDAFTAMRQTLALRINDVTGANRRLTDRQERLETSQSELLQRERLAVSARLVAELSHEIRNPIANLRNCLEIVRRRVSDDPRSLEFTELAIDELLRMHELAEQLLDLNRPRDPKIRTARVDAIVREVSILASAGSAPSELRIVGEQVCGAHVIAAIAPDALKQVLLNLVQNAREALSAEVRAVDEPGLITINAQADGTRVVLTVTDNGPGISVDVLPQIFDPFFTTKGAVHGIGLGLFVAEGLVRTSGGRITAANQPASGASFQVELPQVAESES
ncbi:MAG: ATP-binding protein [Gemmatimonadaceae bacterium]